MSGRPSRRSASKNNKPNKKLDSSLYLGYVEDGETVEMIMKKFEKLEQIQSQSTPTVQGGEQKEVNGKKEDALSDQQLAELFKETSTFSVDMVMDSYDPSTFYSEDGDVFVDEVNQYFSDDEEQFFGTSEDFFDEEFNEGDSKKKKRRGQLLSKKDKPKLMEVTSEEGYVYTIKKKTKLVDPNQPSFVRLPPLPIPLSWAKTIKPFSVETEAPKGSKYFECDIISSNLVSMVNMKFQGMLIDPPWKLPGRDDARYITPKQLEKIPFKELVPVGFIFIWVEKEFIFDVVRTMHRLSYVYVENLVWVKFAPNNTTVNEDSEYFKKSKTSLLIFKCGDGLELRHQRNPDVVFDFVRHDKELTDDKPELVYHTIETLLPTANYDEKEGKGKLLELYAKKGTQRKGWTTIAQK